jgi:hypothetical protein
LSEIDKNGLDVTGTSVIAVKGGEVLAVIYERMQNMSGDPTAATLYGTLLKAAGRPYVAMLRVWVMTGRLVDPYEELLVKESKFINRGILEMDYTDEYWERRYTVSDPITWHPMFVSLSSGGDSSVMGQHCLRHQNDTRQASPLQGLWAADYLQELACRLSLRAGSIRSYLQANTSTLSGNAGLRSVGIRIMWRMRISQWMTKS